MAEQRIQRRLAAILAADVVGFSRLMGADETGTLAALKALRTDAIDPLIAGHSGRIVKLMGDGALVEFASVVDAVECAVAVQREMAARDGDGATNAAIAFRIGVNVGDVIVDGDDIYGDGVNVAARLEGLAAPGGVCVSATVYDQVKDKLEVAFDDLGTREVKNIAAPVRAYAWHPDGATAPATPSAAPAPRSDERPSIAVLPFTNMSNDPEQEYFSDGLSEDLITDLSQISGLFVIARNSSFAFKGQSPNIKEVGEKLGVRYVMEGSVRRSGERIRINAQLIEVATGGHVWAQRYDGNMADIFDLQDEITAKIVAALEVNLGSGDAGRVAGKSTTSVEAYDLFLKGRTKFYAFAPTAMADANALFEQAIAIDPDYVAPYCFISFVHFCGWLFKWPGADDDLDVAHGYAQKAVDIDETSGMAHTMLGWAQFWMGDPDTAIATMERAVELDPSYAEGYAYLAEAYNYVGEPERSAKLTRQALRNDPMLPPNCLFHLGHSYYLLGRFDEAAEIIAGALQQVPGFVVGHMILAAVHVELDQLDAARREAAILAELAPAYTIERIAEIYPHRRPEVMARLLENLEKAGLPRT